MNQQQQQQQPTKEGLFELLTRKGLKEEAEKLTSGVTTFEEFMQFREEQWKEFYQLDGIAVYNSLHPPQQQGKPSFFSIF